MFNESLYKQQAIRDYSQIMGQGEPQENKGGTPKKFQLRGGLPNCFVWWGGTLKKINLVLNLLFHQIIITFRGIWLYWYYIDLNIYNNNFLKTRLLIIIIAMHVIVNLIELNLFLFIYLFDIFYSFSLVFLVSYLYLYNICVTTARLN